MLKTRPIRCIASTQDVCGEGAVWHPQEDAVFWTDINRCLLHRYTVKAESFETWQFEQPVTAVVLTTDHEKIVVVLGGRVVLWDIHRKHMVATLFELPGWPAERCNDARVDPNGILWFGTMQNNVTNDGGSTPVTEWIGQLFSLDANGSTKIWRNGLGIQNTIAWSPNGGQMYFGDTLQNRLYRSPFDLSQSSIGDCTIFHEGFERGLPDGSAVDSRGYLWNCRYGGGCIVRIAPDGTVADVIDTPVVNPTTCAFGGPDLKTLYFTSAGERGSGEETIEGALFSMQVETPGLLSTPFRL